MNQTLLDGYILISVMIAVTDGILSVKSLQNNTTTGRYLGLACAGAAVVDISYLISILYNYYFCVSIMSSIYFVSIDFMLICLLIFTIYFTKNKFTDFSKAAIRVAALYAAFELVVFAINPFTEIALGYVHRDTLIAQYSYQMKPLYWMHLFFTYMLVIVVLSLLIVKMFRVPWEYRAQFLFVIIGIVLIVAVNAVFLYLPGEHVYNLLDYSICGYSLTAFLLYWSCFNYSSRGMLNRLKTSVFENIDQGIVLFDYNDDLILHNAKADYLLGSIQLEKDMRLEAFLRNCNLNVDSQIENDSISVQCYIRDGSQERPLRCDVRRLKNTHSQVLGKLFVFSDAVLETDLLTGFQNWESFQLFAKEGSGHFVQPTAVAICDINGLSVINSTAGNNVGNQKIKQLADTMRQYFPKRTYYVRGLEASLIALCSNCTEAEAQACLHLVRDHFDRKIQFAVSSVTQTQPDILQAVQEATTAMRTKKLLDRESIHSEMLTSLIRALEECDKDTEHHVQRTQILGAELGRRIKLNDIQLSKLSLLCLLHDIGKIGIPLEILNKPGKLSPEEWEILKTHTQKGYDIANSSNELKGIADEIRHHHERWDGKGYPDGLSRESIPLLSRVIAVVDAYDAMVSDRSYRSSMSHEKAIEELKRCAGTQFEPFIVSEFLRMLQEHPELAEMRGQGESTVSAVLSERTDTPDSSSQMVGNTHQMTYSRYVLDSSNRIVYADEYFEKITGYTPEDVQSGIINQIDLIPEEDRTEYLCTTNSLLAVSPQAFLEHKLRRKDGTDIYVFCYGRVYYDSAARSERSEIIITNVASTYSVKMLSAVEQAKAQERLSHWEHTYRTDPLTGLLNHAAFRNDVEQRLLEGKTRVLMLMMDVDKFKEYNDTYGHHNGDNYLILVAQTLLTSLRDGDYTCRMGGDEFAAVLFFSPDASPALMRQRAQQIFDKVNMTLNASNTGTGISMGGAIAESETNFHRLYEDADKALYEAKRNGRGRLVIL